MKTLAAIVRFFVLLLMATSALSAGGGSLSAEPMGTTPGYAEAGPLSGALDAGIRSPIVLADRGYSDHDESDRHRWREAERACESKRIWVEGHRNRHGRWVKGHWRQGRWIAGDNDRRGHGHRARGRCV
ncbi:MAG: hypothetical protein AB9873_10185 [Syntrophobacteraceae bacterium]